MPVHDAISSDWGGRINEADQRSPSGAGRSVLDGAFRLLEALPDADRDHQVRDLSRLTGIPRPSVYRLLAQLRDAGAVERVGSRYVLARSLVDLVTRSEPMAGLRSHAEAVMQTLRAQTGATVSLVVPCEQGSSALAVLPGQEALPTPIYAGVAMPTMAAAALVLNPSPAPGRGDPAAGWFSDDAATMPDLTCFAAAIRVAGRIEAVLQISTTERRPARQFAPLIRIGADRIATSLSVA